MAFLSVSNSIKAILVVLALAGAGYLWLCGSRLLFAKIAGWKAWVAQFPASGIERPGDTFKKMTGWIGGTTFDRCFTLQLIPEGVLVRPYFAKRQPILIPWSQISEVRVSDVRVFGFQPNLHLSVGWEKRLQLSLPAGALPVVQQYVPADRLCRTGQRSVP
jgi:hypothetical protein